MSYPIGYGRLLCSGGGTPIPIDYGLDTVLNVTIGRVPLPNDDCGGFGCWPVLVIGGLIGL